MSAHGHAPNRKEYWVIFVVLGLLTALEIGVAKASIGKTPMVVALVGLAVTKAAIVGLFYMHLKHETKILKASIALPMSLPALYAFVLIAEGAWRRLPW